MWFALAALPPLPQIKIFLFFFQVDKIKEFNFDNSFCLSELRHFISFEI
jgi:hypothetical protein